MLTKQVRPHPLSIAAMIGIAERKRVDFTPGSAPVTYLREALNGVEQKLKRWGHSQLPCFGKPTGIIMCLAPLGCAIETSFL